MSKGLRRPFNKEFYNQSTQTYLAFMFLSF